MTFLQSPARELSVSPDEVRISTLNCVLSARKRERARSGNYHRIGWVPLQIKRFPPNS